MSLKSGLVGAGYTGLWAVVGALPEAAAFRFMERVFEFQYRRDGRQVARLRKTFAPLVPAEELEDTVREAFRWYARYWAQAFRLQKVSSEKLDERFSIHGRDNIEGALKAGKGGLLATLHMGNWDIGGRWVAERWPMTAVAERLEPKALFEKFLDYRRALGMGIIPLDRGTDVTSKCAEVLRRNELLALLADRDLSGHGVPVTFFGRTAKMAAGPAVLSARTGCQIMPAVIYQRPNSRHHAVVNDPLPPVEDESPDSISKTTQLIANAYEGFIREAPAQWHMFQRFWPDEVTT